MSKFPKVTPPTNEERITRAESALIVHAASCGNNDEPVEDQVSDLMTDLRHYCAFKGVSFRKMIERSEDHFTAEATGEPD